MTMGKCLIILGGLALMFISGYAAEIPNRSTTMEASEVPIIIEEPMIMEESRKGAPVIVQDPLVMEEPKKEVVMVEAMAVEDQPMLEDKSLTEQPMKEEEDTVAEMQLDEPQPLAEDITVVEDQVASARGFGDITAADVLKRIYAECLQMGSFACVKPKVLEFLRSASKKDRIMLTRDLSIEKTGKYYPIGSDYQQWNAASPDDASVMFERIDDFLSSHELKIRVPKEIVSGNLVSYVPKFLLQNVPTELHVPLTDSNNVGQERGFLKKIVMPFLLGLKFKATALIPLALALIALKTWKALTLGLLSIVLSGALVIFRLAEKSKQRVPTYEVVHVPHHIEHSAPPTYDHHAYGRAFDAQPLAYRAHKPL